MFASIPWFTWPIFATRSLVSISGLGAAIRLSGSISTRSGASAIMQVESWLEEEVKTGRLVALLPRDSVEARLQGRAVPYIHSDNMRHAYIHVHDLTKAIRTTDAPEIAEQREDLLRAADMLANWDKHYPQGASSLQTERTRREYERTYKSPHARNLARAVGFPMPYSAEERSSWFALLADDSRSHCPVRPGQLMLRGYTGNRWAALRRDIKLLRPFVPKR